MMRGEIIPDQGSIYVQGVNVRTNTQTALQHIGVCPQFDALDPLSVRQQLLFYARVKGIKDIRKDVDFVIQKVGLAPFATRLTSRFSGGNKRKLSLAIALLGNPTVLILDEPSSAMDAISKREMWKMLSSITPGRSVLLTTHSMEEADELATRVAILSKRILAIGTSQELRQRYSNVYEAHLVLTTAPASTRRETEQVEAWIRNTFSDATFEGVNLGGQMRFMIPADSNKSPQSSPAPHGLESQVTEAGGALRDRRSGVLRLIETLEEQKDNIGVSCYTVGMGTLEMVFLKIIKDFDVQDEDEKPKKFRWKW